MVKIAVEPYLDNNFIIVVEDTDDNTFTFYGCSRSDGLKSEYGLEDISEIAVGTQFKHENLIISRLR